MRIISVRLSRLGLLILRSAVVLALACATLFAFAGVAAAQTTSSSDAPAIVNIFNAAQLIALVGGLVIPFVVALATKYAVSPWLKSLVAVLSAGLLALATWLTDTSGSHSWKGAVSVFVVALVSAAASRVTVTGGWDTKLGLKTQNFGLGVGARKA